MASSAATTPDEYIASPVEDRRHVVARVREVARDNLPTEYEEGMRFGMGYQAARGSARKTRAARSR